MLFRWHKLSVFSGAIHSDSPSSLGASYPRNLNLFLKEWKYTVNGFILE